MSKPWWRRNTAPLVVGVVLAIGAVVSVGFNEWHDYYGTRAVVAEAASGQTTSFAGVAFGPATLTEFTGELMPPQVLPSGTRLLLATVEIDSGEIPATCTTVSLMESTGSGREWDDRFLLNPSGAEVSCKQDFAGRQTAVFSFVVPTDATGPFTLKVQGLVGDPRQLFDVQTGFVHFSVEL